MLRLWFSLITLAQLVACGASSDSSPSAQKSTILFPGYNATLGVSLWKSDGTSEGTGLVKDISPLTSDLSPGLSEFTSFNGKTYFLFMDQVPGQNGLWVTDGTEGGTKLTKSFQTNLFFGLTPVNGLLFFSAHDGLNGQELWKSDGTAAGTSLVTDLTSSVAPTASSGPAGLTAYGDVVLFSANDFVHGLELWRSDGSPEGTTLIKDIFPGVEHGAPANFVFYKGKVWFSARTTFFEQDVWSTDGTEAGTVRFTNLAGLSQLAKPIAVVNDQLILLYWDTITGREELWATDGTETGTVPLLPPIPEAEQFRANTPIVAENLIFFFSSQGDNSTRIWRSDGTPEGTFSLADPRPDILWYIYGKDAVSHQGGVYFHMNSSDANQIWRTDGTDSGTNLVTDLLLPKYQDQLMPFAGFFAVGESLCFGLGRDGIAFLWKTDGAEQGTVLVKDIYSQ